jgi:hypothetical protein
MHVRQYAYLRIASDSLDPAQITEGTGVVPDEAKARGSHSPGPPPVPRSHLWHMRSGVADDASLDRHFDALFPRLQEHADGIAEVVADRHTAGYLQVVRHFNDEEEDFDPATYGIEEPGIERLAGQHPFLGWGLDADRLALVIRLGLCLDVDEYG